uniref:Uncharacterized protein n=1 Tax=Amphimedon queenslandica TaxID=400682 RepID=A0A1X7TZ26_AMPQE
MAQPPTRRSTDARSPSVTTVSTRNGCAFDELLNGRPGYCCEPSRLIEQKRSETTDQRVKTLTKNIEDTMNEFAKFAIQGKEVESFAIVKAYVPKRVKKPHFDPMDPTTWKKEGISFCWSYYRDLEYDALIVLTVFTKENVPVNENQEDYAKMLKQKIVNYYKHDRHDERIQSGPSEGRQTGMLKEGYALCLAIKLEDIEIENEDNKNEDDEDLKAKIKDLKVK